MDPISAQRAVVSSLSTIRLVPGVVRKKEYGTSDGVKKGWETRKRGMKKQASFDRAETGRMVKAYKKRKAQLDTGLTPNQLAVRAQSDALKKRLKIVPTRTKRIKTKDWRQELDRFKKEGDQMSKNLEPSIGSQRALLAQMGTVGTSIPHQKMKRSLLAKLETPLVTIPNLPIRAADECSGKKWKKGKKKKVW